jgi:hypothetical protein
MANINVAPPMDDGFSTGSANLETSFATTGVSPNVADFGGKCNSNALLKIVTTGTGSSTEAIEGSADGAVWFPIQYSLIATPDTWIVATQGIATALTSLFVLRRVGGIPWRYLRLNVTANSGMTFTTDVASFA